MKMHRVKWIAGFFLLISSLVFWAVGQDMVAVTTVCPNVVLDIRYATTNNFTGQQVYPSAKACLLIPTARKLAAAQAELEEQGLGLKIFDAYRPMSVQKRFWEILPDERYVANPRKGSRHNRGSAVDVTLVHLDTREELPMPTPYDDFTDKAAYAWTNLPPEVLANRQLLCEVMTRHGFVAFPTEWWHFDDTDWEAYPLLNIEIEDLP